MTIGLWLGLTRESGRAPPLPGADGQTDHPCGRDPTPAVKFSPDRHLIRDGWIYGHHSHLRGAVHVAAADKVGVRGFDGRRLSTHPREREDNLFRLHIKASFTGSIKSDAANGPARRAAHAYAA